MMNKLSWILVGMIIVLYIFIIIITAKEKSIEKENNELKQEIKEYKWQIEQVPYVIESWCNGE